MNERIAVDPIVCHGQACVRGTSIPVHQIVHMPANGDSIEDLLLLAGTERELQQADAGELIPHEKGQRADGQMAQVRWTRQAADDLDSIAELIYGILYGLRNEAVEVLTIHHSARLFDRKKLK